MLSIRGELGEAEKESDPSVLGKLIWRKKMHV